MLQSGFENQSRSNIPFCAGESNATRSRHQERHIEKRILYNRRGKVEDGREKKVYEGNRKAVTMGNGKEMERIDVRRSCAKEGGKTLFLLHL